MTANLRQTSCCALVVLTVQPAVHMTCELNLWHITDQCATGNMTASFLLRECGDGHDGLHVPNISQHSRACRSLLVASIPNQNQKRVPAGTLFLPRTPGPESLTTMVSPFPSPPVVRLLLMPRREPLPLRYSDNRPSRLRQCTRCVRRKEWKGKQRGRQGGGGGCRRRCGEPGRHRQRRGYQCPLRPGLGGWLHPVPDDHRCLHPHGWSHAIVFYLS